MKKIIALCLAGLLIFSFAACSSKPATTSDQSNMSPWQIPDFEGEPFAVISNLTSFKENQLTTESFESYSPLDHLGRPGDAMACIGKDLMPTEDRGSIGQVKPAGWHTVKYDIVDGKYLYNRCHLIGFQLTGENANEQNLITGTRYMNVEGMLPFENMVADYIKETNNHVLYHVSPVYFGDELLCRGVIIEAYSVEDRGEGINFNVYVFNDQPGIEIDYKTGESHLADSTDKAPAEGAGTYILNTKSKKIHSLDCKSVASISENNKKLYTGPLSDLEGYSPCGTCKPLEALK